MEPGSAHVQRLALHEIVRTSVGRQEDLRLLRNVALQAGSLPAASCQQLLHEASLREEWRTGREVRLLAELGQPGSGLGALTQQDGSLLVEQLVALVQLHDEQQQQRRAAAAARHSKPRATLSSLQQGRNPPRSPQLPSTAVKPATTAARTAPVAASAATLASTAPGPGSPARGGSPAGAALRAYLPRAPHTPLRATAERLGPDLALSGAAHTTASRLHGGVPGPGGGSGGRGGREGSARHAGPGAGAGASPAAPRLYPLLKRSASAGPASSRTSSLPAAGGCTAAAPAKAAAAGALVSSPAANTSTGRPPARPSTVQGGAWAAAREEQQQRAGSCYLPPPSPGGSRTRGHGGRPASAPDEAIGGGPGGPGASSAGGASAAAAAAGAAGIGLGAQPQGQGRFRQLLRLQALLLQGVHEHAALGGSDGAHEALAGSVAEGQAFFGECWREAAALVASAAPAPASTALGSSSAGGAPGGRQRQQLQLPAWDCMLRLAQLGLTRADVARLDELRRRQAARTIQRHARAWLRALRQRRQLQAARARASAMHRRLRDRAATIIQSHWRAHMSRLEVAALRADAAAQHRQRRLEGARCQLAAVRIQRAWRAHHREVAYNRGLAAGQVRLAQQQQQHKESKGAEAGLGCSSSGSPWDSVASAGQGLAAAPATTGQAASAASTSRQQRAVVLLQAHARGWLVRRSTSLWWHRGLRELRLRRARVASWQAHQRFMAASYDMQAQLLGSMAQEAQVVAAARRGCLREEAELAAAFQGWLLQQQRVALSQPLPKGWVPHPHPGPGPGPARMCFLNTHTGELHALHPAMADLAQHAQQQRAAAQQGLQQRQAAVEAYLRQLAAATAAQQAIALKAGSDTGNSRQAAGAERAAAP